MRQNFAEDELPDEIKPKKGVSYHLRRVVEMEAPPFTMVGNGESNHVGKSVDMVEVCAELNRGELRVLRFLKDQYSINCRALENYPHVVTPTQCDGFTDELATGLRKNYKHMEHVGVLRRVKKGTYMINPSLIISTKHHLQAVTKWDSLKKEDDNDS